MEHGNPRRVLRACCQNLLRQLSPRGQRRTLIVIISDTHFGRTDPADERVKERQLIECLETVRKSSDVEELILLGDIFDAYIEYQTLVPKGFSRFLGMLGVWADEGIKIRYFAGNHDPWHGGFFRSEYGASFVPDHEDRIIGSRAFRFVHGDGLISRGLYRHVKPILRHRVPVTVYKSILPGDTGLRLAKWVNERFSAKTTNMETVRMLREYAFGVLESSNLDVFVAGHSHHAEHVVRGSNAYLNSGSWHYERTFALVDGDSIRLVRYDNGTVVEIPPDTEPTAVDHRTDSP